MIRSFATSTKERCFRYGLALMVAFAVSEPIGAAFAQSPPQPDPVLLARMLAATQSDRANILNALTEAQARGSMLTEDLAKAKARIKELEPKTAETPAPAADPPK